MITIDEALKKNNISDGLFDAEILLAHVLNVSRSYLRGFSERELSSEEKYQFDMLIQKRLQGMPIAYLTGHREFWSLDLEVTKDTLIPRPETECLVEHVLAKNENKKMCVADLGTGTGAIALALAFERPDWQMVATDIHSSALDVAKNNAARLDIKNVTFCEGSWFDALPHHLFDIIVSNPPYIACDDPDMHPAVLQYEPRLALISDEDGLYDIQHIVNGAGHYLKQEGWLFLEHGFKQGEKVRRIFLKAGYNNVLTYCDLAGFERITVGQWCF